MARAATRLTKYRAMRGFARTPEPRGKKSSEHAGHRFVIHEHAARRLHYDFRLEQDGVLLSWAVPKGPSLSPKARRLAVRTEDHPVDYADFEGVIPKGQYGGGTVVVWDRGTWEPENDPREGLEQGRLTFALHGEKLHGRWHLVRMKGVGRGESWLLFKGRDDEADDRRDLLAARPDRVISGRSIETIAEAPARVWQSAPTVAQQRAARIATARRARPPHVDEVLALVAKLPLGFQLTNLDRVLYPEQGITKGHLIAYLAVVAEWMLPQVANRPLTLVRCPEGREQPCFFQRRVLRGSPPAIHPVAITEAAGDVVQYMTIRDMPGLVALAQLGTLEIHTWGSHAHRPEQPDLMVFDLDPDEDLAWDTVALAALHLRRRLDELGFTSFVNTTGGKGLHVVAPIRRGPDWGDFKAFTKAVAKTMARDEPTLYTTNMGKAHRRGKIYLDYLRNGRGATFIAPYSPRARAGAPVAVPITWEELARGVDPAAFTTSTVPRRLARLERDPWEGIEHVKQSITAAAWKAVGGRP